MNVLYVGNRTLYNDALCELISVHDQHVKITRVPPPKLDQQLEPTGGSSAWQACLLDLSSIGNNPDDWIRRVREILPNCRLVALLLRPSEELARSLVESGADYCLSFDSSPRDLELLLRGPG